MMIEFKIDEIWFYFLEKYDIKFTEFNEYYDLTVKSNFEDFIMKNLLNKYVEFKCIATLNPEHKRAMKVLNYDCYRGEHKGIIKDIKILYAWTVLINNDGGTAPYVGLLLSSMKSKYHNLEFRLPVTVHDPTSEFVRVIKEIRSKKASKRFDL